MSPAPRLRLDDEEREALERAGIALRRLAEVAPEEMARRTGMTPERCTELVASARFQRLGSVGPATAQDLLDLGYRRLEELAGEDPHAMFRRLQEIKHHPLDPCCEDALRCAVAQVEIPTLPEEMKQWFRWQPQRGRRRVEWPFSAT